MLQNAEHTQELPPIIGSYRRFGKHGVVYQVLSDLGAAQVKIRVLETDEETAYPLEDAQQDPAEA